MDKIITDPRLVPIAGTFKWWLSEDFQVNDDVLGLITVPKGFITDLGSIPRIFWNIVPPEGPATDGYVIHDWLYASQKTTRLQADQTLNRLMAALQVGWLARETVYGFLRVGGWIAWNSDAKTGPKFYTPPVITPQ